MVDIQRLSAIATDVRMVCYAVLGAIVLFHAAGRWHQQKLLVSAIHLLAGIFLLSSFHFALSRDAYLAVFWSTPTLVLWTITVLIYLARLFRRK